MAEPSGFILWQLATEGYATDTGIRRIAKAMRGITVRAHFSHDGKGALHPVKAHVRMVDQETFDKTMKDRIAKAHATILALRDGKGRPPFATFPGHWSLGPIGITYARLHHIIEERKKHGQDLEACFKGMADAIVMGRPTQEPAGKDNKRTHAPQVWLTHGDHQVTLSPFWEQPGLPTSVPAWIVSAYEMGPGRRADEAAAKPVVIERVNAPGKK